MAKIKICGITKPSEAEYLNKNNVDYAGFVFFEKSKRNIDVKSADAIFEKLNPSIKKVAVMVSPDVAHIDELQSHAFDILQIHKELSAEVLEKAKLPVWYAVNITESSEIEKVTKMLGELPKNLQEKIKGLVVDAKNFGSGVTFDWQKSKELKTVYKELFEGRSFILAGGLNPSNVKEGILFFEPDVVDVSSGVEGEFGKSEELITEFAALARSV